MAKSLTLGEKIRMFRKRAKISQSSLELEIDASFGSLSRIENDQTNPTKETLMKIAKALKLREDEITYLFHVRDLDISKEDIEKVIKQTDKILSEIDVPAYVYDYRFRVWNWNKIMLKMLELTEEFARENRGVSVPYVLFDSQFGVVNKIPTEFKESFYMQQVLKYKRAISLYQNETWLQNEIISLRRYSEFNSIWKKIESLNYTNDVQGRGIIKFNINGVTNSLTINQSYLYSDPRFLIIEYYPKDSQTIEFISNMK